MPSREIHRFPTSQIREILLANEDEWLPVKSINEGLIRISDTEGSAGIQGFKVELMNGNILGVASKQVVGVRV